MKMYKTFLVAAVFMLSNAPLAHAGTKIMATGPANRVYPSFPYQSLQCNILNANKTPKPVTIEVMDYYGNIVDSSGPLVLAPQTGASITNSNLDGSWCRFTVDGSPKKWRAVAIYGDATKYTTVNIAQ